MRNWYSYCCSATYKYETTTIYMLLCQLGLFLLFISTSSSSTTTATQLASKSNTNIGNTTTTTTARIQKHTSKVYQWNNNTPNNRTISSYQRQTNTNTNTKRRVLQSSTTSTTIFTSLLPLTKDKLQLIAFAALLSDAVYSIGSSDDNDDAIALDEDTASSIQMYDYGKDAFITLQQNNYCYVAFRGSAQPFTFTEETITNNVQDWFNQNFDFKSYYVSNRFNDDIGCTVQRGYYDSYQSSGGADEVIHTFIDECMSSSSNNQLVLTGHSQGGAAALIGGIVNVDYIPIIITFGQPPALKDNNNNECAILENNQRIWRIINTENTAYSFRNRKLQYDAVPFIQTLDRSIIPTNAKAYHVGEAIHLPPSDHQKSKASIPNPEQTNVVYYESDFTVQQSYLDFQFTSHKSTTYRTKLQYIVDSLSSDTDEINTDGYIDSTQCRLSVDCQNECRDNKCTGSDKEEESAVNIDIDQDSNNEDDNEDNNNNNTRTKCTTNSDCTSGRCELLWNGQNQCKVLLQRGKFCTENTDCESNDCTWSWTCE